MVKWSTMHYGGVILGYWHESRLWCDANKFSQEVDVPAGLQITLAYTFDLQCMELQVVMNGWVLSIYHKI